ncbi:MAG: NAD-dependent epimerase/dehydratase family protein [Rhodobacteraceae bacterium]|nr:NAD-dependent epimerase/dehydratase family protein [Paracoccaceae bacterium]
METALQGRKVLVTGATGFIGRRLVAALVGEGADVTVLTRSRSGLGDLPKAIRVEIGSITDPRVLDRALSGQDVLFNLAYDVRASAAENIAGFDRLMAAAADAGVGRIVHTSSIVVYDAWPDQDCDEGGTMERPGGSPYRQAKIAMERRLMAGPLPAAILQPTIVYGPGSSLWTDGFAGALLAGGVVLPEPEGRCNGVFVDDVVQACLRAAALPDLGRERFVISGPEPFPWSALLQGYARILGKGEVHRAPVAEIARNLGPKPDESGDPRPSMAARVSSAARRVIGHKRFEALVRALKKRLSKGGALYPNHHLLEEYSGKGICQIALARSRLGYAPEYDLARGLEATAAHLRDIARKPT